ncbi:hypothetical protein D3C85_1358320 [compost metagenome]
MWSGRGSRAIRAPVSTLISAAANSWTSAGASSEWLSGIRVMSFEYCRRKRASLAPLVSQPITPILLSKCSYPSQTGQ